MTLTIRPYTPTDQDALSRLMWDYRAALCAIGGRTAEVTERFYPQDTYAAFVASLPDLHSPGGAILIADDAGSIQGCGMLIPTGTPDQIEIKRVYVTPEARGTGLAAALVQAAITRARDLGHRQMVLDTMETLTAAIRLYERLGFQEIPPFYQTRPDTGRFVRFYGIDL